MWNILLLIRHVPRTPLSVRVSVWLLSCALCFTMCIGVCEEMEKNNDAGENPLTLREEEVLVFFSFFVAIFQDFVKLSKHTVEACGWKWTLRGSRGSIKAQLKKLKPHWASKWTRTDCCSAACPHALCRQVKFSYSLQKQHPEQPCAGYLA